MDAPPPRPLSADRAEIGPEGEIVLICPAAKSWAARKERTLTTAEYPGTAVEWEGRIFEVQRVDPTPGGGVRYRLAPWQDEYVIRRLERYNEATERARENEQIDRRMSVRNRRVSILLAPLAGLLPAAVQKEMEREFGAPAVAMTISSALPLVAVGFLGLLQRLVAGLGGGLGLPGWLTPPFAIALYLCAESAVRLGSALAMGEPMGSFPVAIAYEIWREKRNPRTAAAAGRRPATASNPLDRFRMLEPLLSLLTPSEQRYLEKRFRFEPFRWGKFTAVVLLAVGGGNALTSILNLGARVGGVIDVVWLLAGGFLAVEQVRRWRRLSDGEPAASVLGALVRPLARPLFAAKSGG